MAVGLRVITFAVGLICFWVAYSHFLPNKEKLRYALLTLVLGAFFVSCGLLASPPERISCWCLGVILLFFSVEFLQKDEKSYSFTCLLLASFFCLCGQLWVQKFLENGLIGAFNLKVNSFQQTLDDYKHELDDQYGTNRQLLASINTVHTGLKSYVQFDRVATLARAYDREACNLLWSYAFQSNDAFLYKEPAKEVLEAVSRSLESIIAYSKFRTYVQQSGTNAYYGPFASDQIAIAFTSALGDKTTRNREGFVTTASSCKQRLFLGLFIHYYMLEKDAIVAEELETAIEDLANRKFEHPNAPEPTEAITAWWATNQDNYPNYPVEDVTNGITAYWQKDYAAARYALKRVLLTDTNADMCRYYLIVTYLEMHYTNNALELTNAFQYSNDMWAMQAKRDLSP